MSKKQVVPLAVELDEVALSIVGWEVGDLHARLVSSIYDDTAFHEVAASAELRFHPEDWAVRFNKTDMLSEDDYLSAIVWQLRSRARGPLMSYQQMVLSLKKKEVRAPKLVSAQMRAWETSGPIDATDLYIWVGAVDWDEIDGTYSEPSWHWTDVRFEVVDYTAPRGITVSVNEASARIRDGENLEVSIRATHAIGSAEDLLVGAIESGDFYGDRGAPIEEQEDFAVQAADVVVHVFDKTGFLLDSREISNYRWVNVREGGRCPPRSPSLVCVVGFELEDLSGEIDRVVIRFQDPA